MSKPLLDVAGRQLASAKGSEWVPMTDLDSAELIAPRTDERLDLTRLEPYLRDRLPGLKGPLSVAQFGGGHANLTYVLRFGDEEFVLRRPPNGPVAPGSHDMSREHRVLSRLHEAYPLAPRSFLLCNDEGIIGAVFVVVERRHGFVIRRDLPERFRDKPALNRTIGEMIIDCLAALHRVDPAAIGLSDLGRSTGFVQRQFEGWSRRWHDAVDGPNASADRIVSFLARKLPGSSAVSLVHNDYKLDNILVDTENPGKAVAVLDWDMCTRGDPLADLGYLLNYWAEPGDDPDWRQAAAMPTWRPGFPSRDEAIARYADATGFDMSGLKWHRIFGVFKLAVILQQIYVRFLRGQTQDNRFRHFGVRINHLLAKAEQLVESA